MLMAEDRRIIAVVLPEGYTGASDFAKAYNVEVIGTCSESVFLREYSSEPDQPWKRSRGSCVGKKNWPEVVLKESIVEDRN